MKPLSKQASAALSALKVEDPTSEDEARVRQNLERTLGIIVPVASVSVATTAVSAQAAGVSSVSSGVGALSIGAKAVAFVLAVGVGATVTVKTTHSLSGRAKGAPSAVATLSPKRAIDKTIDIKPPPIAAEAAAPVEPTSQTALEISPAVQPSIPTGLGLELAAEVRPSAPVAMSAPPRARLAAPPSVVLPPAPVPEPETLKLTAPPMPPPAATATTSASASTYDVEVEANFAACDPATERRSAASARRLLSDDRPEEAVWLLSAYQKRCPSGHWSDEAWSVRMASLCNLHRYKEAQALLQWFSTESPARRAVVVEELRGACPEELLTPSAP